MFSFRRMTPADKPALMAIAARIWDGTDYLPAVFEDWVADPAGEFTAVLLNGRIVGCGKLTFLTPVDAWFEGLRKDPDLAEKGVTTAVTAYFLSKLAGRRDLASIRFSTYVKNLASITANERHGFRRLLTLSCKTWNAKRGELEAFPLGRAAPAGPVVQRITREEQVFAFLDASGYMESTKGMLLEGWRALPYSRELLASRYIRTGNCWGIVEGGALTGLSVFVHDTRHAHTYIKLVLIDARDAGAASALFDHLFTYAKGHVSDYNEIELIQPPIARVRDFCAARGFRSWEQEDDFLVYEHPRG